MNKQFAWQYAKRTLALLLAVAISVNGWLNYGISVRAAETFTVELEGADKELVEDTDYTVTYNDNVVVSDSESVKTVLSGTQLDTRVDDNWYSANDVVLKAPKGWKISTTQNDSWEEKLELSAFDEEKKYS